MQHTPSDTQTHSLTLMDSTIPLYVVSPLHFAWQRLLIFLVGELMEQMDVNSKFPDL